MALTTTPETLQKIWLALSASPPSTVEMNKTWAKLAREEWVTSLTFEDAVLLADRRLDRHGLTPEPFVKMLDVPLRWIFDRPSNRFDEPVGFENLSVVDAAATLILMERLGFEIDAEPLCALLRPQLAKTRQLTWQGVEVLFHNKSAGRTAPLTLDTDIKDWRGSNRTSVRTPLGYRVEYVVGDDGTPLWLTVHAPRFRKRAEPKLTTCQTCGVTWVKGLPSEDKEHRKTHHRRLAILHPSPDRVFIEGRARDPLEAQWVDYLSPKWKHERMYRRAFAFKREFGYSFSQWPFRPIDDPEPVGYLFADDEGRIVGAAAFRPQPGNDRPWRLDWIWLAPAFRRQGYLGRHWEAFWQRFGEFDIEHPLSEAMEGFLGKRGLAHLIRKSES